MQSTCFVSWPSAPLTNRLVRDSLSALATPIATVDDPQLPESGSKLVQWSSYDTIDHELTYLHRQSVLASSYTFRKALIRKHFLSRCLRSYVAKNYSSVLRVAVPETFEIEISFADELEEMWTDDLFDLGKSLEKSQKWYILKPGMSDRGMGIRLFNTKNSLQRIFEEFDLSDSENESEDTAEAAVQDPVAISQLRHFVIQEYISNPLLLDPREAPVNGSPEPSELQGYKFHLRAYCLASGALQVYLYQRLLALFSAAPYVEPLVGGEGGDVLLDLSRHITNTSLQIHQGEENVRLLEELIGCHVRPLMLQDGVPITLTTEDSETIISQIVDILGETFQAALNNPIYFQPVPNAFELYGIDFLVAYAATPASGRSKFQVKLLEINAEPAIELTGPRLSWILEDLFTGIGKVCVEPFLTGRQDKELWAVREERHHFIKVFDEEIRSL